MTGFKEELTKLNSLLEEAESSLTKDEIKKLFSITRKRIQEIEQKALNRLNKNKPNPEDNSAKDQ